MKIKRIKERFFYLLAISFSIFLLFFFITGISIGYEAKRLCQEAKWEYKQSDCVEALMAQLDDENQGYKTRNHSIWALGQFGDKKALSVLQKYYIGNIPEREPLDDTISQYELRKAINLVSGGKNMAAWIWRWGIK